MPYENRLELAKAFISRASVVVELGVAKGHFSYQILEHTPCHKLYSIDRWAGDRCHTNDEMIEAADKLSEFGRRSIVIKAWFQDALELFPDRSIDFLYIDGYAHTGQNGGKTLRAWWPKVKSPGVFAGHDYSTTFPQTVEAVNEFFKETVVRPFGVTGEPDNEFPSWYYVKGH